MSTDCGLRGLDLLDAAITQIEQHPETWDQGRWRCKSGMCLGGWMCDLTGGRWLTGAGEDGRAYLVPEPGEEQWDIIVVGPGIKGVPAGVRAERLLGFGASMYKALGNPDDDRDLFSAYNTLADIKAMRDDLRAHAAAAAGEPA